MWSRMKKSGLLHLLIPIVAVFGVLSLVAGCTHSSSPGNGLSYPNNHEPKPISGDLSVFLRKTGTRSEFEELLAAINEVSPAVEARTNPLFRSGISVEGVEGGVLVIGFEKDTSDSERMEVEGVIQRSAVVDHVEHGGCDVHVTECDNWMSSAAVSS
jgi:hypothetical protein